MSLKGKAWRDVKAPRDGCIGAALDSGPVEQGEPLCTFWEEENPLLSIALTVPATGRLQWFVEPHVPVQLGAILGRITLFPPSPPETPTPPAATRPQAAPARRSTMADVEELVMVEQAKISDLTPQGGERPQAMPAPEERPRARKRPRVVNRNTKPTDAQLERFDTDLQELYAMGYTMPRAVVERAMFALWLALPLAEKVRRAYEQEEDEVRRGYGQGAFPW